MKNETILPVQILGKGLDHKILLIRHQALDQHK